MFQNLLKWIREYRAIIAAILLLVFCFCKMDTLIIGINRTLLSITAINRSVWLDWLFAIITLYLWVRLWNNWYKINRVVTSLKVGLLLVPIVLYSYFRFAADSPYVFTSFWNGPVNYLDGFSLLGIAIIVLFFFQRFNTALNKKVKKESEIEIDSMYAFNGDKPIKIEEDDLFNMDSLVNRIVNFITYTDVNDAAFSMGIVGDWGDGKTSLMNLVDNRIKEEHKDFIIVNFNPRASRKADYIQEDFLKSLKRSLSPFHSGVDRAIDKYADALDLVPGVPDVIPKLLKLFQLSQDNEVISKRKELLNAIKEINRRIVVLVDDLDRLTGEELIEVMKVLDTNGAFPNMFFLTSFDKQYVNTVLNNYLNLKDQKRLYTDKYFTVEIKIPLHPSFRLMDYLIRILKEATENGFIKINEKEMEEQTKELSSYITSRLHTIRDIKRFVNQFLYDYAEIQNDVSYRDYFLLELIKFVHPDDYKALYKFIFIHRGNQSFLEPSSEELIYLNDDLLPQKSDSNKDIERPIIKPESLDILKILFPVESDYRNWYEKRYKRLFSVSSFEHYFYNYEFSHLRSEDIDHIYTEKNITGVCKKIDDWANFSQDLKTYLLSKEVGAIKDQNELRRYMQVLLYAAYKYPSINYPGQSYSFIRNEDVHTIINNCNFKSLQDYIIWLKDSLEELMDIDPVILSNYLKAPINALYSDKVERNFFIMTQQEFQNYALALLRKYLAKVENDNWDADTAYMLMQIQGDVNGGLLHEACRTLHDVMVSHFYRFIPTLPFFAEQLGRSYAGYNVNLRFKAVFEDYEEFEVLINKEYVNNNEIQLIRAIWPIFKANGYSNFELPKSMTISEAKVSMMKTALEELASYHLIKADIDKLAEEWNNNHNLGTANSFNKRVQSLETELRNNYLIIELRDIILDEIQELRYDIREYKKTAKNINKDNLRVGDIIKMKDSVFAKNINEQSGKMIYKENLFTFSSLSEDGHILTKETSIPLTYEDIEAVIIDGKEDAKVYYQPGIMASVVMPGQSIPAHKTDYSYFMDHFKKCFNINNKSYYDLVKESGFQFVHEVQHWLTDRMGDNGLKINNSVRDEI